MKEQHIIDKLGQADVMAVLGLSTHSLRKARRDPDGMPSSWFVALEALGESKGIHVPRSAFKWRSADGPIEFVGRMNLPFGASEARKGTSLSTPRRVK